MSIPSLASSVLLIAPSTRIAFAKSSLNVATVIAIASTAAIFGLAHKKNSNRQAITATFQGIVYGAACARFGLASAIAAHIVNNTIAITVAKAISEE